MAKKLSKNESLNLKNEMLVKFDDYLTGLIEGEQKAKAEKISYWVSDWIKYLEREENFSPNKMLKYKRGSIVKVHLGFNVGSEEGGLHYAIVIDANNDLNNPVFYCYTSHVS
ncbi:type II toxin-antitoxin system PemK/MazF family toxin [Streptococcus anginosus]|uniref:type II toxin-antitoxin system PemK/MazF family toxin n=1 Tax=Streptococcus anginosus TaxID=1328 RepID=UPI0021F90135|nr:type II toxin-antitoxin system PemK/MazF family toxin [Streptococcus anginosus]MCW1052658.1 type II toxin-antitoxin system PemK/MazF family toxin [Streptococcus anginosus]